MREFSNFPPFNGRAPGIKLTNSNATCFAFSSSLHTRTSQSTGPSPASSSAPRFCSAAARLTPSGRSSLVCSAAEPCQTPSTRVGVPPIDAARGTVVSITIVPGFHTLFNCLSSATIPEQGTVNNAIPHAAAAERLSRPSISAAPPMRSRNSLAVSCARAASREPIRMYSPAFAIRNPSPAPSAPAPARIAIFRAMTLPPVSNPAARSNRRHAFPIRIRRFAFPAPSMVSSKTSKMLTQQRTALEFRKALGHFTTGVTVVTVEREPGKIHGMTANSFTSVSLDPMLILVCVDHRAKMLPLLEKKERFGISVLKTGQEAISEFFAKGGARDENEERLSIRYRQTSSGIFVLENVLLQLTCRVVASHGAGDHTIFIGAVEDAETHEGEPLLYFRGEYRRIARPS